MKISQDLHNSIRTKRSIAAVAVGTTGTGVTGKPVDREGYGGVEFVISYGAITATTAVFTVTVKEGDATGSLTSVADTDLLGTELLAGVGATATRTSGTSKNVSKRIGYKGLKRYVNCSIKSTSTAGTPVSATAILFNPEAAPQTNP
jgi:hypothetical protein